MNKILTAIGNIGLGGGMMYLVCANNKNNEIELILQDCEERIEEAKKKAVKEYQDEHPWKLEMGDVELLKKVGVINFMNFMKLDESSTLDFIFFMSSLTTLEKDNYTLELKNHIEDRLIKEKKERAQTAEELKSAVMQSDISGKELKEFMVKLNRWTSDTVYNDFLEADSEGYKEDPYDEDEEEDPYAYKEEEDYIDDEKNDSFTDYDESLESSETAEETEAEELPEIVVAPVRASDFAACSKQIDDVVEEIQEKATEVNDKINTAIHSYNIKPAHHRPYEINKYQFDNDASNYTKTTAFLYDDLVLSNDANPTMYIEETISARLMERFYSESEHMKHMTYYVRNDKISTDYEVIMVHTTYEKYMMSKN